MELKLVLALAKLSNDPTSPGPNLEEGIPRGEDLGSGTPPEFSGPSDYVWAFLCFTGELNYLID